MLKLIELTIIAAAVDGVIDILEQDAIIRCLEQNKQLSPVTRTQLTEIQQRLIQRFRNGETRQDLIREAASSLDDKSKILAYAISIEIALANKDLTESEADYLSEQRKIMGLDPVQLEKIHFSANLRYGILINL